MTQKLSQRLEECARRAGGKRALARQTGISEAQLFRYLRGEADPPLGRLREVAVAADVGLDWLINGTPAGGAAPAPEGYVTVLNSTLQQALENIETVLQEQRLQLTAARKSQLVLALCKAAMEEERRYGKALLSQRDEVRLLLEFFGHIQSDMALQQVLAALDTPAQHQQGGPWVNHLCRAAIRAYSDHGGQDYFDRLGEQLPENYQRELDRLLLKAQDMVANLRQVADLGCGNGRHLLYLRQRYPHLELFGLEPADHPYQLCKTHEQAGRLPENCVVQGDMRQLPFENASMDLVLIRAALFLVPLVDDPAQGLRQVFAEVRRVLRPGGVFHGFTRYGHGLSFFLGHQLLDERAVQQLAAEFDFVVVTNTQLNSNQRRHQDNPEYQDATGFDRWLSFDLVRR